MILYDNKQWIEDIDKVLEIIPEIKNLVGKTVLITGASGLVCSPIVDIIFRYNDTHDNAIKILAAGRQFEIIKARFGEMVERDDFTYVKYDASKTDNTIEIHADYIIHGASNASPNKITEEPVETMMSNLMGMKFLLDYAKKQKTNRVLFISSSEVYGIKEETEPYKEGQYGYIDILKSRNSYSIAKRATETLCISYADEYGVDSVIVRPGHIYGPTASIEDNRVSSSWAYAAARGEDIIMKSDGAQIRSYCYCLDCASAILKVLLCGDKCQAYNISNQKSVISIKDMAEIIAKSANVKIRTENASKEEKKRFNPMSNSSLDSTNLEKLGWKGCFDAQTGFEHTMKILNRDN